MVDLVNQQWWEKSKWKNEWTETLTTDAKMIFRLYSKKDFIRMTRFSKVLHRRKYMIKNEKRDKSYLSMTVFIYFIRLLSIYLSVCLLSLSLSLCIYIYITVYFHLSIYLSVYLFRPLIYISICDCSYLFHWVIIKLSVSFSLSLSLYIYIYICHPLTDLFRSIRTHQCG